MLFPTVHVLNNFKRKRIFWNNVYKKRKAAKEFAGKTAAKKSMNLLNYFKPISGILRKKIKGK